MVSYFLLLIISGFLTGTITYVIFWIIIGGYFKRRKRMKKAVSKLTGKKKQQAIENWDKHKKIRRVPWYKAIFLYPFISLIILAPFGLALFFFIPAFLDLPRVLTGTSPTITGIVEEAGYQTNRSRRDTGPGYYIRINGQYFETDLKVDYSLRGKEVTATYLKHVEIVTRIEEK